MVYLRRVASPGERPLSIKTDTGRAGEFLAAYILETHGVEVHHVDRAGADLWCRINGAIFTVQVKAATQPTRSNEHTQSTYYAYLTKKPNADWHCFVALDRQLLLMRPSAEVLASTLRIAPSEFNAANQRRTIEQMLKTA
jgi:hypothetical protein